jgi:predicted alpha/beta-hydrolase family hydrolase
MVLNFYLKTFPPCPRNQLDWLLAASHDLHPRKKSILRLGYAQHGSMIDGDAAIFAAVGE